MRVIKKRLFENGTTAVFLLDQKGNRVRRLR
jgi:hypothetical protein